MTDVYCTDLECVFNKLLTCQKGKIRLELDANVKGDNWICWDCKLPPESERRAPDSLPAKVKAPAKGKIKGALKKKKGK